MHVVSMHCGNYYWKRIVLEKDKENKGHDLYMMNVRFFWDLQLDISSRYLTVYES